MRNLLTILLLSMCILAKGQQTEKASETRLFTSDAKDNWFIGLSVGAGASNHIFDTGISTSGSWSNYLTPPYTTLSVGKLITPGVGLRLQTSVWSSKAWLPDLLTSDWEGVWAAYPRAGLSSMTYQRIRGIEIHGDVLFNLTNLFKGYNIQRKNTFSTYLGTGYSIIELRDSAMYSKNLFFNTGLMFEHKFSNALAFTADIRETIIPLYFNTNPIRIKYEGLFSVSVGMTYTFPGTYRGFRQSFLKEERDKLNEAVNELRNENEKLNSENNKLSAENSKLDKALSELKADCENVSKNNSTSSVDQFIKKYSLPKNSKILLCDYVGFDTNKSTYHPQDEKNLKIAADALNQCNDCLIEIFGYADPNTGTKSYNLQLSKRRAEYVAQILKTRYNISEDRIKIKYFGENESPLDNQTINKIVLFFLSKNPNSKGNEGVIPSNGPQFIPQNHPDEETTTGNTSNLKPIVTATKDKNVTFKTTQQEKSNETIIEKESGNKNSGNNDIIATETMQPGSRLTLLALKYYGDKAFWVYIYEANKKVIKNPNNVPVGTKLIIPSKERYNIDANNTESISKAKKLTASLN